MLAYKGLPAVSSTRLHTLSARVDRTSVERGGLASHCPSPIYIPHYDRGQPAFCLLTTCTHRNIGCSATRHSFDLSVFCDDCCRFPPLTLLFWSWFSPRTLLTHLSLHTLISFSFISNLLTFRHSLIHFGINILFRVNTGPFVGCAV